MRFLVYTLTVVMTLLFCSQAFAFEVITEDNQVVRIPIDTFSEDDLEEYNNPDDDEDIDEVGEFLDNIDFKAGDGTVKTGQYSEEDLYLAAQLIHAEGANQSKDSFEAMAGVLYNRLKSKKFPRTIAGIVFQKNQFTVTRNQTKFLARVPSKQAIAAINQVFTEGENPLPEAVMYFRASRLGKNWKNRTFYKTFGGNNYYK